MQPLHSIKTLNYVMLFLNINVPLITFTDILLFNRHQRIKHILIHKLFVQTLMG